MKNVIKFLAVVMFITTATMQAQDKPACCVKKAEKKIEMMKEKLSLSDSQVAQVTTLVKEEAGDFDEKIKVILTPEQYSQFQEMSKEKSCCTERETAKKSFVSKVGVKKSCCKDKDKKKSCCKKKS